MSNTVEYLPVRQLCYEQVMFLPRVCLSAENLENYWSEIDVTW